MFFALLHHRRPSPIALTAPAMDPLFISHVPHAKDFIHRQVETESLDPMGQGSANWHLLWPNILGIDHAGQLCSIP
jgi:hypothetical protein